MNETREHPYRGYVIEIDVPDHHGIGMWHWRIITPDGDRRLGGGSWSEKDAKRHAKAEIDRQVALQDGAEK